MANPICPTDCTTLLNEVLFSKCAPSFNASEIVRIFLAKPTATKFNKWEEATEWTQRLKQKTSTEVSEDANAKNNEIRTLTVIGDKPAPSSVVKDVSNGRKYVVGKDHTVNFTIDDITAANYEFLRATECGGLFRMWYETKGGYLYGGNEGILANIFIDAVLNRGADEIETLNGTATWRSKFSPERVKSPIQASE